MSAQLPEQKRVTVPQIRARKGGEPIVCLTAYDTPTARVLDVHCDLLLVGDSVGMVVHGLDSTVGVTMEMMILHGRAVMRGSTRALVAVDLPFGSYEAGPQEAFANASRLMKETGCQAVKIESGAYAGAIIAFLTARGIPVIGHVGLRPQAVHAYGGTRARGRSRDEREVILAEARAADEAGVFALVIEAVAEDFATEITASVSCPTIGIGASAACDGQVLVTHDMLGLFDWTPRFVRRYADLRAVIGEAAAAYAADVRARRFPGEGEVYRLKGGG
jgi:3-methyl-2-oxobutanoate hydroxymethyltransferase